MQKFNVSVDLTGFVEASAIVRAGLFDNLSAAVERVAMAGAERWKEAVLKAPLWDGERRAYADTIKIRNIGPYESEIFSDYKFAEDIETGRPPYDMKRMLDASMKVRISKKGRRYLIIPMRKNVDSMPADVYAEARKLTPSNIIGSGQRQSGTGAYTVEKARGGFRRRVTVTQHRYLWGGKLPSGTVRKLRTEHKTDPYAGMYRFEANTPGSKSAYSTYITFRVMAEGQAGWIIPAKPGLYIAKSVSDGLLSVAPQIFAGAIAADLQAAS